MNQLARFVANRRKRVFDLIRRTSQLLVAAVAASVSCLAAAQPFPTKPITIVVPYTPASGGDIVARAIAPEMSRSLGQPVLVDNRAGAAGTIGTAAVVRAPADGYTVLMSGDTITMTPYLYKNLSYSTAKDLIPVGRAAFGVLAFVVHPSVPANSVPELVNLAKARPGGLAYVSPGIGTPQHVVMELFKQSAGIDMLHVPYKGMAGALTDLIGGQAQVAIMSLQVAIAQVNAGKLRLIAVLDNKRSSMAPTAQTILEAGYPELATPSWLGLFVAAGTPPAVIERLHASMNAALLSKNVQEALQKQGLQPSTSSTAELTKDVARDLDKWKSAIAKAGIVAE